MWPCEYAHRCSVALTMHVYALTRISMHGRASVLCPDIRAMSCHTDMHSLGCLPSPVHQPAPWCDACHILPACVDTLLGLRLVHVRPAGNAGPPRARPCSRLLRPCVPCQLNSESSPSSLGAIPVLGHFRVTGAGS